MKSLLQKDAGSGLPWAKPAPSLKKIFTMSAILLLLLGLIAPAKAQPRGQGKGSSTPGLFNALMDSVKGYAPGSSLRASFSSEGFVRYLGVSPENYFSATGAPDPDARARAFLDQWGGLFQKATPDASYGTVRVKSEEERTYVRLQQRYADLPVFNAQIIVQLDATMNVTNIHSDIMHDFSPFEAGKVSLNPTISYDNARVLAIEKVVAPGNEGTASEPELMIYSPSVVGDRGVAQLVWQTTVEGITGPLLTEMVLINAHTGAVSLRYPLIYNARYRAIYDAANTSADPGILEREEGDPVSPSTDVNQAYDYFGDTYDFYYTEHRRDSFDNLGATLSATVRYCDPDPTEPCPYHNAFWDGFQERMYFGQGYAAADDVVSHELTHGVTDHESALIYSFQSGAINESFSDVWGEFVDLTNGAGTDTPEVRWLMGEDIPGGAIRDISDPTVFGDPDRIGSPLYYCGTGDHGGVHTNSGVSNKLCYLLTDGDLFNGRTVSGMGISRVAELYYECQTNLLTPSSDYLDLYNALSQAAINLGFTQAERDNIEEASQAVEMDEAVCDFPPPDNDECAESISVEEGVAFSGSTLGATGSDITSCADGDTLDVWHSYTPTESESFMISTSGSNFDTTLAVFDSCGGTELACDDDGGVGLTSRVIIDLTAGQTYQIRIAGWGGAFGSYVLRVGIDQPPLFYEIDVGQDGSFETGGIVNLSGQEGVGIDIYVDGYACPPDDLLFGVQTYISLDESLVQVNSCVPYDTENGGPFDPVLSNCVQETTDVYFLLGVNFYYVPVVGGTQKLGTIEITCIGEGITDLVIANNLTTYGYPAFNKGFLSSCDLNYWYPTDAVVTIEQFPICACMVTPNPATVIPGETQQFTADPDAYCTTPNYTWSDNCMGGTVDATGLFTAREASIDENCQVCATDNANTGADGSVTVCCADVTISVTDSDEDGILDAQDNCSATPNGPLLGTCVKKVGGLVMGMGATCTNGGDCAQGDICEMNQEDVNVNDIGDVCECYADINGDCKVDLTDLVIMKDEFLLSCPPPHCTADLNGDGKVNLSDLVTMKMQFFQTGCPC